MPVLSYAYLDAFGQTVPAIYSHETHALIEIIKRLWSAFHDRDEVYAVVCNLHRENHPAADLAIISELGVGVVELKGHRGAIRVEGDAWFAGSTLIDSGKHINPKRQVKSYAEDVRDRLLLLKPLWQQHEIDNESTVKIQTAVCFTHPDAQIENFSRRFSPPAGERAAWEDFKIIKPADIPDWAASLRFGMSQHMPKGAGYRTLSLTWDEIKLFAAGYLDASPWTEIANLMPSDEPYGVLILKEEQQRRAIFTLDRAEVIIGRDPRRCNLVLPGEYTLVSNLHARIQRVDKQVWLTDRNSTNGTYLNGQRVVDSQLLEFGHKIRLGSRVDSSRACALEFQSPDYLFAGPTDRGSTVLAAR